MTRSADVVVCGAGIAGIATAYHLAVEHGVRDVVLVDERPPLSLTSDKSTECYRNWWPGPDRSMVALMNRSIDLLERWAHATENAFHLNRNGYVYLTADPERARRMEAEARAISALGAGPLRVHRGESDDPVYDPPVPDRFEGAPDGADLFLGTDVVRRHWPFLTRDVVAALHPRRCGWLAAQQLGMVLLEKARAVGARLVRGRLVAVDTDPEGVATVRIEGPEGGEIATRRLVVAAGPFAGAVAGLLGIELPIVNELHWKVTFPDHRGVLPRHLPLLAWEDPITLPWDDEERRELERDPELAFLTGPLPAGVHFRPEGGEGSDAVLMLWAYDVGPREVVVPPEPEPLYPEVVLRGVARMVPAMAPYLERSRRPFVDGGYYTKTRENRPLACPLPVPGAHLVGALSGFGIMAAPAAAELAAAYVTGSELPPWAPAFALERYDDPAYRPVLEALGATAGQL